MSEWQSPQILDRCEGLRNDPQWVAKCWQHPRSRVVEADPQGRLNAEVTGINWQTSQSRYDPQTVHLIGLVDESPVFVRAVAQAEVPLRAVMDALPAEQLQIAFAAAGLVGWHSRAGFCPGCGRETEPVNGGLARRCANCEVEDYPRTDPAVIVAVTDADQRLLLGRQPSWPARRYSVLAGFCEVGESLEQTVHREIAEEVGLGLSNLRYLGSQPWPFPRSMMVAFAAVSDSVELRPAPGEIEHAAWFSVAELQTALEAGQVELPMAASISRRMIEAWLSGRLNPEEVC